MSQLPSLPRHVLDTALKQAFRKAQSEAEYAASRDASFRSQSSQARGFSAATGRFVLRSAPTPWTAEVNNDNFGFFVSSGEFKLLFIASKLLNFQSLLAFKNKIVLHLA